jgi:hypothetical protein
MGVPFTLKEDKTRCSSKARISRKQRMAFREQHSDGSSTGNPSSVVSTVEQGSEFKLSLMLSESCKWRASGQHNLEKLFTSNSQAAKIVCRVFCQPQIGRCFFARRRAT